METFTGKPLDIISFLMAAENKEALYDLSLHKEAKKRSLSANNYFYALITKIAEKLRISLNEVHNQMLSRYGYPEFIDDKVVYFILPDKLDVNTLEGVHLKPTSKTQVLDNGDLNRVYLVMRGSHTYNSVEMARLIEGVISEAKELGIETITVTEKDKMLEQWGKAYAQKNKSGSNNTGSKTTG
jgi:hypothetical protein